MQVVNEDEKHFQADELWIDKADGPVSRVHTRPLTWVLGRLFFVGVGLEFRLHRKLFLCHLGLLARLHFFRGAGLDFLVAVLLLLLHTLVVHFVAWVSHDGLSVEW